MARKKTAIRCTGHESIGFTLTCSEETLKKRHDQRGDPDETNYFGSIYRPIREISSSKRTGKASVRPCGK